jgi:hypothetical protein
VGRRPEHRLVDARAEATATVVLARIDDPRQLLDGGSRQSQCPAKHPLVAVPSLLVPFVTRDRGRPSPAHPVVVSRLASRNGDASIPAAARI